GEERVRRGDREGAEDQEQHDEDRERLLGESPAQRPLAEAVAVQRLRLDGCVELGHRFSSSTSAFSVPVMAATASSIVVSDRRNRATRRPRRSTSIRSATSKTCGRLWLISTTEMPASRTLRVSSRTFRDCTTPSAAVGSSMKTTRLAHVTARPTATP